MARRDHVGAFLVHGTWCTCRYVLTSSYMPKCIFTSHIITTMICMYACTIIHIFVFHFSYFYLPNIPFLFTEHACVNIWYISLPLYNVLWVLIALFIWHTFQKWRNKDVQSVQSCEVKRTYLRLLRHLSCHRTLKNMAELFSLRYENSYSAPVIYHYATVTWVSWCLKSPMSKLSIRHFAQVLQFTKGENCGTRLYVVRSSFHLQENATCEFTHFWGKEAHIKVITVPSDTP